MHSHTPLALHWVHAVAATILPLCTHACVAAHANKLHSVPLKTGKLSNQPYFVRPTNQQIMLIVLSQSSTHMQVLAMSYAFAVCTDIELAQLLMLRANLLIQLGLPLAAFLDYLQAAKVHMSALHRPILLEDRV